MKSLINQVVELSKQVPDGMPNDVFLNRSDSGDVDQTGELLQQLSEKPMPKKNARFINIVPLNCYSSSLHENLLWI